MSLDKLVSDRNANSQSGALSRTSQATQRQTILNKNDSGMFGFDIINSVDTVPVTSTYSTLVTIENTIITLTDAITGQTFASLALPPQFYIRGKINAVSVTSGNVMGYRYGLNPQVDGK